MNIEMDTKSSDETTPALSADKSSQEDLPAVPSSDAKEDGDDHTFLAALDNWTGTVWGQRRILYRLLLLAATTAVIVIGVNIAQDERGKTDSVTVDLRFDSAVEQLQINIDHCAVNFVSVPASASNTFSGGYTVSVRVEVTHSGDRLLRNVAGQSTTTIKRIDVVDLPLFAGQKFCRVDVKVPSGQNLVNTTVTLLGTQFSTVSANGVSWGSNTLKFGIEFATRTHLLAYLEDITVGYLDVPFSRGTVFVLDPVVPLGGSRLNFRLQSSDANAFVRLTNSSNYVTADSNSALKLCLTGTVLNCDSTTAPKSCTMRYTSGEGSTPPPTTVTAEGVGYLHVMSSDKTSLSDKQFLSATTSLPLTSFENANFQTLVPSLSTPHKTILQDSAKADLSRWRVQGPGSPPVVWTHASVRFYALIPPKFTDIFTWTLLSPSVSERNITLSPAFCPGLQWHSRSTQSDIANIISVRDVLVTALGVANVKTLVYSAVNKITSWSGDKFFIDDTETPGEVRVEEVKLEGNILATIVCNIAVSFLGSLYMMYLIYYRLRQWAKDTLDDWGTATFGEEKWEEKRPHVLQRATIFFWAEFVVGLPSQNQSFWRLTLTVWWHMFVVLAPVIPIAIGLGFFFRKDLGADDEFYSYLAYFLFALMVFTLFVGVVALVFYYLNLQRFGPIRWFNDFYEWVAYVSLFFSVAYLVNVSFWILLGITLKPNLVLPIAAGIIVVVIHVYATVDRVMGLYRQLQQDLKTGKDPFAPGSGDEESKPEDFAVADIKKINAKDVLALVEKSQALEIVGLSLYEKIYEEILVFLILLFLLGFLGIGFFVLSTSTQFVSALTTVLVFLIGGGINIPLSRKGGASQVNSVVLKDETCKVPPSLDLYSLWLCVRILLPAPKKVPRQHEGRR